MKVYYSGYGFISDGSLYEEVDEQNGSLIYGNEIAHIERASRNQYRGHFVLPAYVVQDLKFIGKAKVEFLLYDENHPPINVRGWEEIDPRNASLNISNKDGNSCSIEIQNTSDVFEDLQTGNALRFLPEEKTTTKPSYTHTSELIQLMDKAIIEFWENHDSKNPPTGEIVKTWLKQEWLRQGYTEELSIRKSDAIDLIMRPLRYK
jgi:hypothetical protein